MEYIAIDFIEVEQPIGRFYIGTIGWKDLISIAEADIRKIDEESKEDNFDSYLGIQRRTDKNRLKDISSYVKTVDATFPTSIILHIESLTKQLNGTDLRDIDPDEVDKNLDKVIEITNVKVNNDSRKLEIRKNEKIARILDGQHRIEGLRLGFENSKETDSTTFQLNVTIFVDLDLDNQAQIFSVINKAQTKVNKSLVYDLYDYAKTRSPQKTAHDIVRLLNKKEKSPFYRKIKVLGTAEDKDRETIAQATLVELVMEFISKDPMKDRDILKRRTLFGSGKLEPITDQKEISKRIFRNLFINAKDEIIMTIMYNYFNAVKSRWPNSWDANPASGQLLNKSTGIISLMKILRLVVNHNKLYDQVISEEMFRSTFSKVQIPDGSFTKENYIPGTSGQAKLFGTLKEQIGL